MKRIRQALSIFLLCALVLTGGTFFADIPAVAESAVAAPTVYVNGECAENGSGTVNFPYNSFAAAVDAVRETGGTVVVTGKTVIDTRNWRTGTGSLTVTSVDPATGTDYRGANCTGAYLANRGAAAPFTASDSAYLHLDDYGTNKIILSGLHYATKGAGMINFMMHDLELDDVVNYRSTDWKTFTQNHFNFGFNKNSLDNLCKTTVTLNTETGNFAMGLPSGYGGNTKTAGLDLTVNSVRNAADSVVLGNRGGGTLTVQGDVFLTLNMPDTKVILMGTGLAIEGKISLICNYGATRDLRIGSIDVPKYILNCAKGATAVHGETADRFLIRRDAGSAFTQAVVKNLEGKTVDILTFDADGTAEFVAPEASEYTVSYLTLAALGAQKTAVGADGTYAIRFAGGISATEGIDGAGLRITSTGGFTAESEDVRRLTAKLLAKENSGITEITASELGMEALFALVVDGIPAGAADTFVVTPFVIIGGKRYEGTPGSLTVGSRN